MFNSVPDIKPTDWISKKRETMKPWSEFLAFNKFKSPTGFAQSKLIIKRLSKIEFKKGIKFKVRLD